MVPEKINLDNCLKKQQKSVLEDVLGMNLTDADVTLIHDGWFAFYREPLAYRNGPVPVMVRFFLESENKNEEKQK